jgi:hypothetical protein
MSNNDLMTKPSELTEDDFALFDNLDEDRILHLSNDGWQ